MRIFYVCDSYLNKPMASTIHVKEIIENMIALGHAVTLFAPGYGRYPGSAFAPTVYLPTTNIRIVRVLLFYALLGPALALACLRRWPDVFYIREMLLSTPVQLVAKLYRIPVVVEVNGFNDVEMERGGTAAGLEVTLARWAQWCNVHLADRLVAVSPKIQEGLVNRYGVDASRIAMFRNGANTALFQPMDQADARHALGLLTDHQYICFVGSFYAYHGVDDLIRAFALLAAERPNVRLLLVGDGSERARITQQVDEMGLRERVMLTGPVRHEQVPLYINSADICVAPYNNQLHDINDLSPLKIFEFLACGRPIISTTILGSMLTETEAGMTVPPENPAALAEAIVTLLDDPALRKTMGQRGRTFVLAHYTWRHTAIRIVDLCQSLVFNRADH